MVNLADYSLIIFDKDGTLIDFDYMWGHWVTELARRLQNYTGLPVSAELFRAMGFDPVTERVLAEGKLAVTPMILLRALAVDMLEKLSLPSLLAEASVARAWFVPDPVALARPFADLPHLFGQLRRHGLKIAVATTDDREPTAATLAGLGVSHFIDSLLCADDHIPVKPAPDMILTICQRLNLPPARAIMVGDSIADMQMGRAAQAGLSLGVLSGVSSAEILRPHADLLLPSIADLLP